MYKDWFLLQDLENDLLKKVALVFLEFIHSL